MNDLTHTPFVGISRIGKILGVSLSWGRALTKRADFPEPDVRILMHDGRIYDYWSVIDLQRWWSDHGCLDEGRKRRPVGYAGKVVVSDTERLRQLDALRNNVFLRPLPEPEPKPATVPWSINGRRLTRPERAALIEVANAGATIEAVMAAYHRHFPTTS